MVEQRRLDEESLDDEEASKRFTDNSSLVGVPVSRANGGRQLVANEKAERRRASGERSNCAVLRDTRRSGEVTTTLRVRNANDDHRTNHAERSQRVDRLDDARKVLVNAAVQHIEHRKVLHG